MRGVQNLLRLTEGVAIVDATPTQEEQDKLLQGLNGFLIANPPPATGFRLAILVGCPTPWMIAQILNQWPNISQILVLERNPIAMRTLAQALAEAQLPDAILEFNENLLQDQPVDAVSLYTTVLSLLIKHNCPIKEILIWETPAEFLPIQDNPQVSIIKDLFERSSQQLLRLVREHGDALKPSFLRLWGHYLARHGSKFHAAKVLHQLVTSQQGDQRDYMTLFQLWMQLGCPELALPLLDQLISNPAERVATRTTIQQAITAQHQQNQTIFQNNLSALAKIDPDTAQQLAQLSQPPILHCAIEKDVAWKYFLIGPQPRVQADLYPILFSMEQGFPQEINHASRETYEIIQILAGEIVNRHVLIKGIRFFDHLFNLQWNPMHNTLPNWQQCFYLVEEDLSLLHSVMHVLDIQEILTRKGNRFYLGTGGMAAFLDFMAGNPSRLIPKVYLGIGEEDSRKLHQIHDQRQQEFVHNRGIILNNPTLSPIQEAAEGKRPWRILFITSYFTTVLQYVVQDLVVAFQQLGHATRIVQDRSISEWLDSQLIAKEVVDFKPDAIFIIDHIRSEFPDCIPKAIPFICWVQDLLPHLTEGQLVKGLNQHDLTYCMTAPWATHLKEHGYPHADVMLFGVNTDRFKPLADRGPPENSVAFITHLHPQREPKEMPGLFQWLDEKCQAEDAPMTMVTPPLVEEACAKYGVVLENMYSDTIYLTIANYIRELARMRMAEWLLQAGIPLALYGEGWDRFPHFAPFAKGILANGEPLVRAYQKHKVIMHVGRKLNLHNRVFEVIASGGFVLVRLEENDYQPGELNDHLTIGEEIIAYQNRPELITMVKRAFQDESWRQGIIQRGRQKVLAHESYACRANFLLAELRRHVLSNP
ncbi:MAG: glycosyltransferase family 1 protein [Magnetococcales bacterium]|nr:glycosyltransferase family 1 protein [Magnetococcales bacterium]